jgi:hypothetical protein
MTGATATIVKKRFSMDGATATIGKNKFIIFGASASDKNTYVLGIPYLTRVFINVYSADGLTHFFLQKPC